MWGRIRWGHKRWGHILWGHILRGCIMLGRIRWGHKRWVHILWGHKRWGNSKLGHIRRGHIRCDSKCCQPGIHSHLFRLATCCFLPFPFLGVWRLTRRRMVNEAAILTVFEHFLSYSFCFSSCLTCCLLLHSAKEGPFPNDGMPAWYVSSSLSTITVSRTSA